VNAKAGFRQAAADPRGEPDPVLDKITYHRAPSAATPSDSWQRPAPEPATGPQNKTEAEPGAEAQA
jgi:hypothetical protein